MEGMEKKGGKMQKMQQMMDMMEEMSGMMENMKSMMDDMMGGEMPSKDASTEDILKQKDEMGM